MPAGDRYAHVQRRVLCHRTELKHLCHRAGDPRYLRNTRVRADLVFVAANGTADADGTDGNVSDFDRHSAAHPVVPSTLACGRTEQDPHALADSSERRQIATRTSRRYRPLRMLVSIVCGPVLSSRTNAFSGHPASTTVTLTRNPSARQRSTVPCTINCAISIDSAFCVTRPCAAALEDIAANERSSHQKQPHRNLPGRVYLYTKPGPDTHALKARLP